MKEKNKKRSWKQIVSILSCIVVFCTTYALILPAVTLSTDTFCGKEEHTHNADCYRSETPLCGLEEGEGSEGHTHTEDCYGNVEVGRNLICGMEEVEGHVHDDSCYQSEFEYGLICGKEESEPTEGHEHNEDCYQSETPICGKEEHEHIHECYSNKEDVEDPKDWEEAYKDINKEEDAKTRILTVAKNEVGYKENEANFSVDENDKEHYYTRYGHLYEDMYGDWNNYFTGYVLKYADVKMNFDKDISKWQNKTIDDQKEEGEEGNVVFFRDEDGELRSGIVTKVDDLTKDIRVIEGDVDGEVKEERVNKDKVIAYLSDEVTIEDEDTPLAGDGVEKEEQTITQTAKDAEETVEVTAEYTKDAEIPEEAEFRVKYLETLEDGSIRYDIGFWVQDENIEDEWKEIEPKSEVNVSLRYLKNQFEKNEVEKIIHDLPDGSTEDIPVEMKSFNDGTTESTFVMNSFSTITVKKARSSFTITPKEGNVLAPGVDVNMFNYDSTVNDVLNNHFPFRVKEPNQDTKNKVKEGLGYNDVEPTAVNLKNGYPVITSKAGTANLEPIFSTTNQYYQGTAVGGGYLFSKDANGYYEYDSSQNAAYFDKKNNTFTVYNQTVAPAYKPKFTNFFPFNELTKQTIKKQDSNHLILDGFEETSGWENKPKSLGDPDLWFGMSMSFDFIMPENGQITTSNNEKQDMIFEFSGDDDVYVFVDNKLVLQLGGYHEAWTGTINFNTGVVTTDTKKTIQALESENLWSNESDKFTDYSTHNFKFFYLERGGDVSNCKIKFNLQSIPENSLQIAKNVTTNSTNDDVVKYLKDNLVYRFKVLNGENESYFNGDSVTYEIYPRLSSGSADLNAQPITKTLSKESFIELKADQVAVFKNVHELGSGKFYVQEWLPEKSNGAYEKVQWSASGSGGTTITGDESPLGFVTYKTGELDNTKSHIVNFNNVLYVNKLSLVQIEKKMANGNTNVEDGFEVLVQMKDQATNQWTNLPVNTEYKKLGDDQTYKINSSSTVTLKAGQIITFESKFVGGTELKVTEQSIDNKFNENPDYQYQIDNGNLVTGSEAMITVPETEKENHSLKFVITNKYKAKVPNEIQIKKVDNNTNDPSPLRGAKFKLFEEVEPGGQSIPGLPNVNVVEVKNGEQPVETELTGVDGITKLDYSLDPTKVYYLIESQTPDGYLVPQYGFKLYYGKKGELYIATVGDDGKFGEGAPAVYTNDLLMATVTIQNIPGKPLPNTGGAGTKLFTFSGAAVIAASGLMYGYKKKKDKRNGKGGLRK